MTEKLENENQELKRGLEKITKQKSQLENDKDQSKVTKFLSMSIDQADFSFEK